MRYAFTMASTVGQSWVLVSPLHITEMDRHTFMCPFNYAS